MGTVVNINKEKRNTLTAVKTFDSQLTKKLKAYCAGGYGDNTFSQLLEELEKVWGKHVNEVESVSEFLNKKFVQSITDVAGKENLEVIKEMINLRFKGQFSSSMYRRSYRSKDFGYYSASMISFIRSWILLLCCYDTDFIDMLGYDTSWISCYSDIVAWKISHNDTEFLNKIKDMIYGDNNVLLSREVVIGIIRSGNEMLVDDLLNLLLAAKGQEGIRQAILESADVGTLTAFKKIYKCCLDNDIFRFTSAARAFYNWTGTYLENIDISQTRKMAEIGWQCLNDSERRKEYFKSDDPYEIYLSLWAKGCEEILDVDNRLDELLDSDNMLKKYVGWYFVRGVENVAYRHKKAISHLDEEDIRIIALATDNLHVTSRSCYYGSNELFSKQKPDPIYDSDINKRRELFYKLKKIAERIGTNEWVYSGYLFPWSKLVINQKNAEVMRTMMALCRYDNDDEMIDAFFSIISLMDPDLRKVYYSCVLDPDRIDRHRQYLYAGLKDRSVYNRESAVERLGSCKVEKEDISQVCAVLDSKSSSLKKEAVNYLKNLKDDNLDYALRVLFNGKENQLQVAIELLIGNKEMAEKYHDEINNLEKTELSDQTRILLKQITSDSIKLQENDLKYDLFSIEKVEQTLKDFSESRTRDFFTEKQLLTLYPDKEEVFSVFDKIRDVFRKHADYEYEIEIWDGSREKVLFGDVSSNYISLKYPAKFGKSNAIESDGTARLDMVPFNEEFRAIMKPYYDNPEKMAMLNLLTSSSFYYHYRSGYLEWYRNFADRFEGNINDSCAERYGKEYNRLQKIVSLSLKEADQDKIYDVLLKVYFSLIEIIKEENLSKIINEKKNYYENQTNCYGAGIIANCRNLINRLQLSDEKFSHWFKNEYYLERKYNFLYCNTLSLFRYLKAVDDEIIPLECFYDWILYPSRYDHSISILTTVNSAAGKSYYEKYSWLKEAVDRMVEKTVIFESKRGQAETEISLKVNEIKRFEGKEFFVMLLQGLGKDNFFRGYQYGSSYTKSSTLSMLLRKCWPASEDDASGLKALLDKTDIKEKRLIEAAMYAPQWAALIEEITGWSGLKKAVWFFQAHISETFSADKETEVAIYSPISPQKFNDGAFDIEWFEDIYSQLGEKRFKQLYDSAKYLTEGSNAHRRSQLYSDAVRGKLDVESLEAEINDKRNQEKLRAYGLIPVTEEELLHRYLFINNYIKQSKQFGAQRKESEKKAGKVALENLALSSGYSDVNRMLWKLESEKNREIEPMLEKRNIDGYDITLLINEKGEPSLQVEKDGKELKTLPKTLVKNNYIEEVKTLIKELKEQKTRGKRTLEEAMINRTEFTTEELHNIFSSLTIAPVAKALLWKNNDTIGFVEMKDNGFVMINSNGELTDIENDSTLIIAHPHHLYESGKWADFMHNAYLSQLVQPFKQIFREYYPLTDEEKEEKKVSRRYAGYQVQPKKTVALLKQVGWTVDYEEGLQKVCYSDNLVVRLYSQADWFSPADIEAPTLEEIMIYDRKSNKAADLETVNPVIFSEIMRDIDMAVSVAYVGGVDAEASHSTVQMRVAIASELVSLMKLDNVEFTDRHAIIHGKLAQYSVHMGSGIVHAQQKGMIPILAVHSQHRGRIFLPFADDDPKTAEIMSKIVLLAEDTKIKDPEILSRLK